MSSLLGRADLLRLLLFASDPEASAFLVGYEKKQNTNRANSGFQSTSELPTQRGKNSGTTSLKDTPIWMPQLLSYLSVPERMILELPPRIVGGWPDKPKTQAYSVVEWVDKPKIQPSLLTSNDNAKQAESIVRILKEPKLTRRLEVKKTVSWISRAQPLNRIPRQERMRPVRRVAVVMDTSLHLRPFLEDAATIAHHIKRYSPEIELCLFRYWGVRGSFFQIEGALQRSSSPGAIAALGDVIALSDLGSDAEGEIGEAWVKLGREVADRKGRAFVLQPVLRPLNEGALRLWRPLVSMTPSPTGAAKDVETLLTLASIAVRIEPQLLRALRLNVLPEASYAAEILAWRHSALASIAPSAATMHPEEAKKRRKAFAELSLEKQHAAVKTVRSYRGQLADEVWFEEVLRLPYAARAALDGLSDIQDARDYMASIVYRMANPGHNPVTAAHLDWLSRVGDRALDEELIQEPDYAQAVWKAKEIEPDFAPAGNLQDYLTDSPVGLMTVRQKGDRLIFAQHGKGEDLSGVLASLESANGIIEAVPAPSPNQLTVHTRALVDATSIGSFNSDGEVTSSMALDQSPNIAPLPIFRDTLSNGSEGPEMIEVPAGSFLIGSPDDEVGRYPREGPQQRISFKEPFALARYPVTLAEYDAFCDATGREKPDCEDTGRGKIPATNITWHDAKAYCDWLSEETGEHYHLPSEAQWEYACRAGSNRRYHWGDDWDPAKANGARSVKKITTVGSYDPNHWGFYDMHGNVWEWCADLWGDSHASQRDDGSPKEFWRVVETNRVLRGGYWNSNARECRSAYRELSAPDDRFDNIGFRPARGQGRANASRQGAKRADEGGGKASQAELTAARRPGDNVAAEPLARMRVTPTSDATLDLSTLPATPFVIRTDRAELVIQRTTCSELGWAKALGRDRFGMWAEIAVDDLRPRLRYCPPGRFTMGSPEDEPGRYEYEGPMTEVTFETGFWLFETPVTQALYQAVLPDLENPSRFQSPLRPVEQVSWDDAQKFMIALNNRIEGLDLHLPSEAAWEYACRAGTTAATYAGPMEIRGARDAPVLDEIAWYSGNSGVNFDLEKGYDSSVWKQKQYDHQRAGTRVVGQKKANPWGLYDMIGNVLEWCDDVWARDHEGAAADGSARQASQHVGEISRVLRGGSWSYGARYCRSAYRYGLAPADRHGNFGFRPARGQERAQASRLKSAERSGPSSAEASLAEQTAERSAGPPRQGRGEGTNDLLDPKLSGKDQP